MPNLKIVAFSVCEILRGVPKFRNWVTYGQFVARGKELPTAYVRVKFEGRSFNRLRNIGTFRCCALIDPVNLTFDLLTLKSVWESHVTWGTPVQFRLPRPFGFRVRADVRDIRRTDGRTTDADHRIMPPRRGHNKPTR